MARKRPGRKVRVDFRPNRQVRRRSDEWTRQFRAQSDAITDTQRGEMIRAKGSLSRKRTIILGQPLLPRGDQGADRWTCRDDGSGEGELRS